jgi:TonB family protein
MEATMLDTLLESRSQHTRNRRGAIASVAFHASVIFVAVYATASGKQIEPSKEPPTTLHYVPVSSPRPSAPALSPRPTQPRTVAPRTVVVPVNVPTSIPPINVSAEPVTPADFGPVSHSTDTAVAAGPVPANHGGRAYDITEVENPVTSLGGVAPEYPSPLRSSGVEGKVSVEFVVNERGRAEVSSLRILSATNDLFADAVRRALPRMRFKPAQIGNHNVPQLVRQEFSFVLDR